MQALDTIILESNRGLKKLGADITSAITTLSKFSFVGIFSQESSNTDLQFQGLSLHKKVVYKTNNELLIELFVATKINQGDESLSPKRRHTIVSLTDPEKLEMLGLDEARRNQLYGILHGDIELNCLYVTKLTVGDKNGRASRCWARRASAAYR